MMSTQKYTGLKFRDEHAEREIKLGEEIQELMWSFTKDPPPRYTFSGSKQHYLVRFIIWVLQEAQRTRARMDALEDRIARLGARHD